MMKKITMLMAAALIALGGMSATAQNNDKKDNCTCTECQEKPCNDRHHKGHRKAVKGFRKDGRRGSFCPLMEGITLTDTQKQQLQKLQGERRAEIEKMRQTNREEARKINGKYDSQLRSMLTPDQIKTFDANKTRIEERRACKTDCDGKNFRQGKHHKGHRGGKDGKFRNKAGFCTDSCQQKTCTAAAAK